MKPGSVYGGVRGYALRVMDATIYNTHTPSLGIYERRQSLYNIFAILYGKWGDGDQKGAIAKIGTQFAELTIKLEQVDGIEWAVDYRNDFILKLDTIQADIERVIADLGILDSAIMGDSIVPE